MIIHHVVHRITVFVEEKKTIAKKQNSFPVLIHHEKIESAGPRGLGMGEMAGKIQEPFAVPYCKCRHFVTLIFISFYTWSHMVSLCFEAISTEWGKQIS